MSMRSKLAVGFAPLAIAMIIISVAGGFFLTRLGRSSEQVLKDNYRSVLALQRMTDSVEALDSTALFVIAGRSDLAGQETEQHRKRFEEELAIQEGNLTESGEEAATRKLRDA